MPAPLRAALPFLIALALAVLLAASPVGQIFDRLAYDQAQEHLAPGAGPADIVIVELDDETLNVLEMMDDGLVWPYPRSRHATVLETLHALGARAVFVDIIFDLPTGEAEDAALADAVAPLPVVLAGEIDEHSSNPPLDRFIDAGAHEANTMLPLDRWDLKARYLPGGSRLPQTAGEALLYFCLGRTPRHPRALPAGRTHYVGSVTEVMLKVATGTESAPDDAGLIQYFGPPGSCFPRVPYFMLADPDLVDDEIKATLQGATVFVGLALESSLTDPTQKAHDTFATPVGPMPGVEIHAHAFASLREGAMRRLLPGWALVPLFLLTSTGLALGLRRVRHPLLAFATMLTTLCALVGVAALFYLSGRVLLPSPFLFFCLVYYIGLVARRYMQERDAKMLVQTQLFHYLPEPVARHLEGRPIQQAMAGDRTRVTLLFADLAGFTTISEKLPVETVLPMLQEHLRDMTAVIFEHGGTLDKFLGDGIMAFWGAPQARPDHAEAALAATQNMMTRLDEANDRREAAGLPRLHLRVGLHTGDAIIGNIGSELFFDYTAIGDTVNTAARIEGLNKYFGTRFMFSEDCRRQMVQGPPEGTVRLGRIAVKGRATPFAVYTLATPEEKDRYRRFEAALASLEAGALPAARATLTALQAEADGFGPAAFHLDHLDRGAPPRDGDGIPYWPLDAK